MRHPTRANLNINLTSQVTHVDSNEQLMDKVMQNINHISYHTMYDQLISGDRILYTEIEQSWLEHDKEGSVDIQDSDDESVWTQTRRQS